MPNRVTLSQVIEGFKAAVLTITKAKGYSYDLTAEHVYKPVNQDKINSQDPAVYPKIMFMLDSGGLTKEASKNTIRTIRMAVSVTIREQFVDDPNNLPPGFIPVEDQVVALVADLENCFLTNEQLGGLVDDVTPSTYETDSNFTYPDGVVVYWFDINWRSRG